jgi:Transposase DDE domain
MKHSIEAKEMASAGLGKQIEQLIKAVLKRHEPQPEGVAEGQTPRGPGRPEELPGLVLWTALLMGVLSRIKSIRGVWRSLVWQGYDISDETVYDRLERAGTAPLEQLFEQITAFLLVWVQPLVQQSGPPLAPFATQVLALDETTLDPVARKLPILRHFKQGAVELLPGKLAALYDVRLQLWRRIDYVPDAMQNCKVHARAMLTGLAQGSLLLFDLGFFGFDWFDELTRWKYWWISRLREKTSYVVTHTYYQSAEVFDGLVWLGAHHAKAQYAVRLVQFSLGATHYQYLTNVLDPTVLPLSEIARLYARRWDIELAFLTLKEHLGLHLLWNSKLGGILQQVWACLIIAQVLHALRLEIASRAHVEPFDVSFPLLLSALPPLLEQDVVTLCVQRGRQLGLIRPSTRTQTRTPDLSALSLRPLPPDFLFEREPFYPPDRGKARTRSPKSKPKAPLVPGCGLHEFSDLYALLLQ